MPALVAGILHFQSPSGRFSMLWVPWPQRDAQWETVSPLLPPAKPRGRPREADVPAFAGELPRRVRAAGGWAAKSRPPSLAPPSWSASP